MANYYASSRTNYFKVKDVEAFKTEIESMTGSVEIVSQKADGVTLVGLLGNDPDGDGFPFSFYSHEEEEYVELDWEKIFKAHLEDDWVAIIMEAGAEKLRYINGYAIAYNNKGETKTVGLNDIYTLALELGTKVTPAEY
jgi:hypothetical protein